MSADRGSGATPVHVGLMVPANNTTFEREIVQWLPPRSTVRVAKIPRSAELMTVQTLPHYNQRALELAEDFRDSGVDIVLYGCTAAGFIGGPSADRDLADDLRALTRKRVATTAHSMALTLREAGLKRIALVTPYQDGLNTQLKAYLAEEGFKVVRFDSFHADSVDTLCRIEASQVRDMALRTVDDSCDGLFVACAQLPTAEILSGLRDALGIPVFSSNFSCVRQGLAQLERLTG